jgi:predicted outer membrane repeat protein
MTQSHAHTQVAGMSGAQITVNGNATVTDCISNSFGGAMYVNDTSTLQVSSNVQVSRNFAGSKGGGVYAEGATVTLGGACKLQNVCNFLTCFCMGFLAVCFVCVYVYTLHTLYMWVEMLL